MGELDNAKAFKVFSSGFTEDDVNGAEPIGLFNSDGTPFTGGGGGSEIETFDLSDVMLSLQPGFTIDVGDQNNIDSCWRQGRLASIGGVVQHAASRSFVSGTLEDLGIVKSEWDPTSIIYAAGEIFPTTRSPAMFRLETSSVLTYVPHFTQTNSDIPFYFRFVYLLASAV